MFGLQQPPDEQRAPDTFDLKVFSNKTPCDVPAIQALLITSASRCRGSPVAKANIASNSCAIAPFEAYRFSCPQV
jgi:hypothetical protein